jgi:hypothetical protein
MGHTSPGGSAVANAVTIANAVSSAVAVDVVVVAVVVIVGSVGTGATGSSVAPIFGLKNVTFCFQVIRVPNHNGRRRRSYPNYSKYIFELCFLKVSVCNSAYN